MGAAAADAVESTILKLLKEKDEISIIFSVAPSQFMRMLVFPLITLRVVQMVLINGSQMICHSKESILLMVWLKIWRRNVPDMQIC
jgi:hypothetical protein